MNEFLEELVAQLATSKEFLFNLSKTGGKSEVFIGLYADRCCDFAMQPKLLGRLASAGLTLRLDFYGPDGATAGSK